MCSKSNFLFFEQNILFVSLWPTGLLEDLPGQDWPSNYASRGPKSNCSKLSFMTKSNEAEANFELHWYSRANLFTMVHMLHWVFFCKAAAKLTDWKLILHKWANVTEGLRVDYRLSYVRILMHFGFCNNTIYELILDVKHSVFTGQL